MAVHFNSRPREGGDSKFAQKQPAANMQNNQGKNMFSPCQIVIASST